MAEIVDVDGQSVFTVTPLKEDEWDDKYTEREIQACRILVKRLKGLDATLDESEFCRKCSPEIDIPTLKLIIRYKNENDTHIAKYIGQGNLTILVDFLENRDRTYFVDSETVITLIEGLLGVSRGS